jgi:hypothetical protein
MNFTRFLPGTREWRRLKLWRRTKRKLFFRRLFPGIFAPDYIPSRLFPERTAADVERIVKRDFPPEDFALVMAILNEYVARFNDNPSPVRLAALRLANGNVARLRTLVESAKRDYRDVILPAVYPSYGKTRWDLPEREKQRIVENERQQYEDWLRR